MLTHFRTCIDQNLLNPFYEMNAIIQGSIFDVKVRSLAKRYL
jgi:hypothetical protein